MLGVIINVCAVALGGVAGALFGRKIPEEIKAHLNAIFGICAMAMGINTIVLMENMPAVIFSVIAGTFIGLTVHFGDMVNRGGAVIERAAGHFISRRPEGISDQEFRMELITIIVLFCASGTGIYGTIVAGMTGDLSILLSKSIMDFFTALIFASVLGAVVSFVAIPQFAVFSVLYLLADFIYPLTTPAMINDFKACGGILLIAMGFRMLKLRIFPVADMIIAMILVMPCSYLWAQYVVLLL